jgi:hypothetical protein
MQILTGVLPRPSGLTVMIDRGFRRGTDVIKALALGAHAAFVGRPFYLTSRRPRRMNPVWLSDAPHAIQSAVALHGQLPLAMGTVRSPVP